jgi:hypothetical protein
MKEGGGGGVTQVVQPHPAAEGLDTPLFDSKIFLLMSARCPVLKSSLLDKQRKLVLSFQRYKKLNVQVQEKDGETLLTEIAANVQRMLDRKMDAVKVS